LDALGSEHSVGHYLDLWGSLIEMKRTLLSWSSGKDSAWSLHLLRQQKVYAQVPPKVEYSLAALGQSLKPVVKAMETRGEVHAAGQKNSEEQ